MRAALESRKEIDDGMNDQGMLLKIALALTKTFFKKRQWTDATQNKQNLGTIYLDFRKAFDSVSHVKLMNKIFYLRS